MNQSIVRIKKEIKGFLRSKNLSKAIIPSLLSPLALLMFFPLSILENMFLGIQSSESILFPSVQPVSHDTATHMSSLTAHQDTNTVSDEKTLENKSFYSDLPVGRIETADTDKPWGTVLFFPQYHQLPGSAPDDPENDRGETTQRQTYKILERITKQTPVDTIMIEGELYGEVPDEKIKSHSSIIHGRNSFASHYNSLNQILLEKPLHPELESRIRSNTQKTIESIDREVYLKGAPLKLKTEQTSIKLYGAENLSTREKSADLVREHIYLQDRLKSLSGYSTMMGNNMISQSFSLSEYRDMLEILRGGVSQASTLESDLSSLEHYATQNGREEVVRITKEMRESLLLLEGTSRPATLSAPLSLRSNAQINASVPSRSNNPFAHISDPNKIEKLLEENEEKINHTVVGVRNKETAENFADMLKHENKNIGILQYGAGHTEGLVRELQNQGLKVIIVTPLEVTKHSAE